MGEAIREVYRRSRWRRLDFEQHGAEVAELGTQFFGCRSPSDEFFRDSTSPTFVLGTAFEKMWQRFDRPGWGTVDRSTSSSMTRPGL